MELGLVVRFVIGRSQSSAQEHVIANEEQLHGGFLRLDLQVALTPSAAPGHIGARVSV